jgi:hypothetical protein
MAKNRRTHLDKCFNTDNQSDQSSTNLNGIFIHSQLLIDILIQIKSTRDDKDELIEICTMEIFQKTKDYIYFVTTTKVIRHKHSNRSMNL